MKHEAEKTFGGRFVPLFVHRCVELGAMLGNYVELFARVYANLNECMAFVHTEPVCFRPLVPRLHVADRGQAASSAFATSMTCCCVGGSSSRAVFPRER